MMLRSDPESVFLLADVSNSLAVKLPITVERKEEIFFFFLFFFFFLIIFPSNVRKSSSVD